MTNLEFKARVENFDRARKVLRQRQAYFAGVLEQSDTYFHAQNGRLKLREIQRRSPATKGFMVESQLIFYQRADAVAIKRSDYFIAKLEAAENMRAVLAAALGIKIVVTKTRELFLLGYGGAATEKNKIHIRVHLDRVEELGEFVEIEALAGENISAARAEQEAQNLREAFAISPADLVAGSYSDLLAEKHL